MKRLFILTTFFSISFCLNAFSQANVNLQKLTVTPNNNTSGSNASLKFINSIEIIPDRTVDEGAFYSTEGEGELPVKIERTTDEEANTLGISFKGDIEKSTSVQFKYALLLNREVESMGNGSLWNFIEEWWGTKYVFGGATKSGIDCSAFTGKILRSVYNIEMPRTARAQYGVCQKVKTNDLKEGDLVFFNTRGGVSHVGLYLGNNYFVHSSSHSGVVISSLSDNYYSQKVIGGGRPVAKDIVIE